MLDYEFMSKVKIALNFDFNNGFKPLELMFAQRKKIAEIIDNGIDISENLKEAFSYINNEIAKYLGI